MYTQQVLSRQTSNTQLPANSLLSPSPTGFGTMFLLPLFHPGSCASTETCCCVSSDLSESPSTPQLTATVPIRGVGIAGAVIGTGGSGASPSVSVCLALWRASPLSGCLDVWFPVTATVSVASVHQHPCHAVCLLLCCMAVCCGAGRYGLQRANTSTDFVASPSGRPGLLPKRVTTSPRLEPSLPPSRLGMSTPIIDELESKQSMVRSVFKTYHGGVRPCAVDGPGVYYLGVVDMLQRFTWKKRMERWMKSFYKPAAGASGCVASNRGCDVVWWILTNVVGLTLCL